EKKKEKDREELWKRLEQLELSHIQTSNSNNNNNSATAVTTTAPNSSPPAPSTPNVQNSPRSKKKRI
uniref:Uncharacterized protein n=1 Tax=Romanomermis culicivorax TaxID=13658 RepID=A0A915JAN6_ROMCU